MTPTTPITLHSLNRQLRLSLARAVSDLDWAKERRLLEALQRRRAEAAAVRTTLRGDRP